MRCNHLFHYVGHIVRYAFFAMIWHNWFDLATMSPFTATHVVQVRETSSESLFQMSNLTLNFLT